MGHTDRRLFTVDQLVIYTTAMVRAQTPTFEWAIPFRGTSNGSIRALDTDARAVSCAVYEFSNEVDFDLGPGTTDPTCQDAVGFFMKSDPAGNQRVFGTFRATRDMHPGPAVHRCRMEEPRCVQRVRYSCSDVSPLGLVACAQEEYRT